MSNRYSASTFTSAAPGLNTPFFEFRNSATRRCFIEEIGVFLGAATATNVALHRAAVQGTGGANTATIQREDPSMAASTVTSVVSNAFTVAPTFTAAEAMRRAHLPAAIGAGLIWTWPSSDRLIVPVSASIILVTPTIAGAATISTYIVWIEA